MDQPQSKYTSDVHSDCGWALGGTTDYSRPVTYLCLSLDMDKILMLSAVGS